MADAEEFTRDSPLGASLTLIDASAGTGKTFSVCSRVAEMLLRGELRAEDVAIITFTNAAAHELRARMRDFLERPRESFGYAGGVNEAVRRAAVEGLRDATIGTIHHFCQELLAVLGTSGDFDPARTLATDARVRDQVANDAALRAMGDAAFAYAYAKDSAPSAGAHTTAAANSRDAVLGHLDARGLETLEMGGERTSHLGASFRG